MISQEYFDRVKKILFHNIPSIERDINTLATKVAHSASWLKLPQDKEKINSEIAIKTFMEGIALGMISDGYSKIIKNSLCLFDDPTYPIPDSECFYGWVECI